MTQLFQYSTIDMGARTKYCVDGMLVGDISCFLPVHSNFQICIASLRVVWVQSVFIFRLDKNFIMSAVKKIKKVC